MDLQGSPDTKANSKNNCQSNIMQQFRLSVANNQSRDLGSPWRTEMGRFWACRSSVVVRMISVLLMKDHDYGECQANRRGDTSTD